MTGAQQTASAFMDRGGCPICGDADSKVVHSFGPIPIVRCSVCSFLYSGRVFSPEALESYYRNNFGSEKHRAGQEINARVNLLALKRLIPVSSIRTALDIGSGYGYLLEALKRCGVNAYGLEPSRQEADFANQNGAPTTRGELTASTSLGQFDLVCSFEVIEHVLDPRAFLSNALRHVAPGGYLVVMTDNFSAKVVHLMGTSFPKWIPHAHINHFSSETFSRLCQDQADCTVQSVISFTPWELWAQLASRGFRKADSPWNLEATLRDEMRGHPKWKTFRLAVNPSWFLASARRNLLGQLIYVALRRSNS